MFCKFDAIGRQFAKNLTNVYTYSNSERSEWNRIYFLTCYSGGFSDPIATFKMPIEINTYVVGLGCRKLQEEVKNFTVEFAIEL